MAAASIQRHAVLPKQEETNIEAKDLQNPAEPPEPSVSRLLSLPAEIRRQIWLLCIPPEDILEVRLCIDPCGLLSSQSRTSSVGQMLQQFQQLQSILTELGLTLRLICQQTRVESLPFFAAKTVRFCCRACFSSFLNHIKNSGVGVFWMTHVEIIVDLTQQLTRMGYHLSLMPQVTRSTPDRKLVQKLLSQKMAEIRESSLPYYGPLDLMERVVWVTGDQIEPNSQKYVISGTLEI
jgi:hypothetical protein